MQTLKNKTIFITGGSRGIGKAIALRAARDGANIIIAAKSDKPHPSLDILINNASAISLTNTLDTPMRSFDLMHSVNLTVLRTLTPMPSRPANR